MHYFLRLFSCLLLLFGTQALSAQLLLQLETVGKVKTKKFQIGETLTYRLQGSDQWEEGTIENLIYGDNLVVFNNRYTPVDQIVALRSFQPQSWSKPLSYSLYSFGAAWSLFSAGAAIVDKNDPYSWGDLAVTGTSMALGLAIQQLFKKRDYRIGKRRRLRILDLRVFN
ncbi:MAG: hypothetical protein KDC44_06240 [Phaeodactylibacter sp.]|nr:hypothetical protein [Phaeodactylibacter sp.]